MICTIVLALAANVTVAVPVVAAWVAGTASAATITTAAGIPRNRFISSLSGFGKFISVSRRRHAGGRVSMTGTFAFLAALGTPFPKRERARARVRTQRKTSRLRARRGQGRSHTGADRRPSDSLKLSGVGGWN